MDSSYKEIESQMVRNFNLRCIDGSIHGCGKCVGYCSYEGHSGFLTAKMQAEHKCKEKGCFYHYPKPATRRKAQKVPRSTEKAILRAAQAATADLEGLRVVRVAEVPGNGYAVFYAAIAQYNIEVIAEAIKESTNYEICMKLIQCDFDVAVSLILS